MWDVGRFEFRISSFDFFVTILMIKIIIVGGGAAGFFAAIKSAEENPEAEVCIIEKSSKLLSKVKISGGGRCNVTNDCDTHQLHEGYPRGGKFLKTLFKSFSNKDTVRWFEQRGVKLKAEPDGRMFPVTDNSQTIIDCLLKEIQKKRIEILTGTAAETITKSDNFFTILLSNGKNITAHKILIATGGNTSEKSLEWLQQAGIKINPPVPSLFTFNIPDSPFKPLSGISMSNCQVRITGTKLEEHGPVLITHWGLSGPAILRLSAWGAKELAEKNYQFVVMINWVGLTETEIRNQLEEIKTADLKKIITSNPCFAIPKRLWEKLCELSGITEGLRWVDLSNKNRNKLMENLIRCQLQVKGKTTFKEEFVTCGGIDLNEVNPDTMECKKIPGLYFAGEVLDIDGITGGYNFQAAWSTGFVAGKAMGKVIKN